MTDDVRSVSCVRGSQRELGRYGRRSEGSPAARQRNVTSIVSVSISLFSLSSKLLLLFKTSSCLERRAHCWFAAERAASLADAVPPCGVRADTVKVSEPIGKGCVIRAPVQPAPKAATLTANPRANTVLIAITPLAGPCYPISNLHPVSLEFLPVIAALIPLYSSLK